MIKTILVAGAAYYLANMKSENDIETLKDNLSEEQARNVDLEAAYEQLKNQEGGELHGDLKCYLTVYASRIANVGDNWNSGYELTIKNTGTVTRNISAVRVFWTIAGRKCTWSAWSNSPYVLKPGVEMTIRLYGAHLKFHFKTRQDIRDVEKLITAGGKRKDDTWRYVNELPIECEAQFILTANGNSFARALKGFPGVLIARTGERIYYPYRLTNGTDVKAINDIVNPPKEDEE